MNLQDLTYTQTTTKTLTVNDVYSECGVVIPHGYQFVAFRPPVKGEIFLTNQLCSPLECNADVWDGPRIIVREVPKPEVVPSNTVWPASASVYSVYGRDVEIPSEYKYVAFRPPKYGEFYVSTYRPVATLWQSNEFWEPRIIVEKIV